MTPERFTPDDFRAMKTAKVDGWCYACHQVVGGGNGHYDGCVDVLTDAMLDQAADQAAELAALRQAHEALQAKYTSAIDALDELADIIGSEPVTTLRARHPEVE